MKYEIEAAASFWSKQLDPTLGIEVIEAFKKELMRRMCEKFALHWYDQNPTRGQAFREMCCDYENKFIDETLLSAATAIGFSFYDFYTPRKGFRMWVDPGEVEVSFVIPPYRSQILYQSEQHSLSVSPPRSPRGTAAADQYYFQQSYADSYEEYPVDEYSVYDNWSETGLMNCSQESSFVSNGYSGYPVQYDLQTM